MEEQEILRGENEAAKGRDGPETLRALTATESGLCAAIVSPRPPPTKFGPLLAPDAVRGLLQYWTMLDDSAINAYATLVSWRSRVNPNLPRCLVADTFAVAMAEMQGADWQRSKEGFITDRATGYSRADLFIFPIHG